MTKKEKEVELLKLVTRINELLDNKAKKDPGFDTELGVAALMRFSLIIATQTCRDHPDIYWEQMEKFASFKAGEFRRLCHG